MFRILFDLIDEEGFWSDPSIDHAEVIRLLRPDIVPEELLDLSDLEGDHNG